MKRDMELIRKVMLEFEKIEEKDRGSSEIIIEIDGYTEEEILEHVYMLYDGGYVNIVKGEDIERFFFPIGLTWKGHDFLSEARNDTIWNEGMKIVRNKGIEVGIDVMKAILSSIILKKIGL